MMPIESGMVRVALSRLSEQDQNVKGEYATEGANEIPTLLPTSMLRTACRHGWLCTRMRNTAKLYWLLAYLRPSPPAPVALPLRSRRVFVFLSNCGVRGSFFDSLTLSRISCHSEPRSSPVAPFL
jgi:hypothetical protein